MRRGGAFDERGHFRENPANPKHFGAVRVLLGLFLAALLVYGGLLALWISAIDEGLRIIGDTLEQLRFAHGGRTRTRWPRP